MSRKKFRIWTDAEDAELVRQMEAKTPFPKMFIEGRSLRAIESRAFHRGLKLGTKKMIHRVHCRVVGPPKHVLEDRDRRLAIWPDFNQQFFGDPVR
jgi:hypothetical protein